MLKAIGKSINIRVSRYKASKIPIIILGNTPITESYFNKVQAVEKIIFSQTCSWANKSKILSAGLPEANRIVFEK